MTTPHWPEYNERTDRWGTGYTVTASTLAPLVRTPGVVGDADVYRTAFATATTRRSDETAMALLRESVYRELHRQATGCVPHRDEEHTTA